MAQHTHRGKPLDNLFGYGAVRQQHELLDKRVRFEQVVELHVGRVVRFLVEAELDLGGSEL